MADARQVRAERRTTCVAQTAPMGRGVPRRSASPAANAATDPAAHEQQDSSLPPSVRWDDRTATPSLTPVTTSSSHARRKPANAQAALLMARELLRYDPIEEGYDAWLGRITELVNAAGEALAPSRSLRPPPSWASDMAHGAPPPPPLRSVEPEPRHNAPPRDPPRSAPAPTRDEASCQVVQRPQGDARALPVSPRQHQDRALLEAQGVDDELCEHFIVTFQGTRDRAPLVNDLRRVKQQPGETLHKFIQSFTYVRLKIRKASDEAIISAFTDGVRDVKMREELAIHDDLCSALEMFNQANKCAKAEEGRLSLLEHPEADPENKKAKALEAKHKGPVVLAAELEMKHGRDPATTPTTARSSGHSVTSSSATALSAATVATGVAEAAVEAAGTTATLVRTGATSLVRIAGEISLATAPGMISLVRPVLRLHRTLLCSRMKKKKYR
nr:uncharacterized protein LOC109780756 [Aegilops tauschii subsp. strangulata]